MKKVFTLVLVMAMAITSFAQFKSVSRKSVKAEPAQTMQAKGFEELNITNFAPTRSTMFSSEVTELSYTYYDWQSNMGPRNYVAVWPDGYAVMCYTLSTATGGTSAFTDRGTGLAIWDPAVGEWEYTETKVEGVKTGFGAIARYKENGLVLAAHTASDCRIFIVEDFRDGNRDFGQGVALPTDGEDGRTQDICWPAIQCSGENLDIIHILATEYTLEDPMPSALLYTRYEGGEFTVHNHVIPNVDRDHMSDGGSNIAYFMLYDPETPNRVSFILNNAWSDCKLVISEDNGENWGERVFWKHPDINYTFPDEGIAYLYPRWTNAAFDSNDNLHVVYEYNGTNGAAGDGSYFPSMGGIGYWSEILPLNAMCLGGLTPEGDPGVAGQPFIMDSTYMMKDLYESEWYWSDANHDPLPEYIGELEIVDIDCQVLPRDSEEGYWLDNSTWGDHGSYNGGKAQFATMHYDKATDMIVAFWSMEAGDEETVGYNPDFAQHYLRLFGNLSLDGGNTWYGTKALITDFEFSYEEMVYDQMIPYVYNDAAGDYVWVLCQMDAEPGTCVQGDETEWANNRYTAIKVYINNLNDVDENPMTVAQTINVYPNPAQGSFNMTLTNESDVNIYNTVGQLVKTYNNVKEMKVNLEPGVYFVNAGNETVKVVVK